ncbi:ArfGap-domain-containing protein [Leucogyrophana mollusca]|uniref:ArfGap-domain-containing protein n=1 Tax=Leucogyrophana mollusca TaxID=85980 RepID=A0ACB8B5G0_9AGAM|nr:ArfGap-domain-containing protein [Leucogyrophana mollusca]
MSRQDKATTERHTKILRELVKQPENKVCADCKRNDPRWASWNLGVFLCIRCSGIHRGMGTHISRVKSVDLDIWTPEQMESIQKWGNRRANLYWEAHLKAGHVPPDHKMESFVRSKYESRRWALEGPPPTDPATLEGQSEQSDPTLIAEQPPPVVSQPHRTSHSVSNSISTRGAMAASPSLQASFATNQPQSRQLLSAAVADRNRTSQPPLLSMDPPATQATPQPPPQDELFSLDFHNPTPTKPGSPQPSKDVKQDILSLFSSPPASVPAATQPASATTFGQFTSASQPQSPWDQFGSAQTQQQPQGQSTSMMGSSGTGMWGATSGWSAPPIPPAQGNMWGSPTVSQPQAPIQQMNALHSTDIWGSSASGTGTTGDIFGSSQTATAQKKDDVFGDLWGDFQ